MGCGCYFSVRNDKTKRVADRTTRFHADEGGIHSAGVDAPQKPNHRRRKEINTLLSQ